MITREFTMSFRKEKTFTMEFKGHIIYPPRLVPLDVFPSSSHQHILPPEGKHGFSEVDVEPVYAEPLSVTPTASDQHIVPRIGVVGFSEVDVSGIKLEDKEVNINQNGQQVVTKSSGKDGMTTVAINVDVHPIVEGDTIVFDLGSASVEGDTLIL